MKIFIILLLVFFVNFSLNGFSQQVDTLFHPEIIKKYNSYINFQETNNIIIKYCDPTFPKSDSHSYNTDLQKYAKEHTPIPVLIRKGYSEIEKASFESKLILWKSKNPYYPQFIPYHLYKMNLTIKDDVIFYENALKEWIKSNPEKYKEINNLVE